MTEQLSTAPLHQNHIYTDRFLDSLEQSLRAIWGAVSWAAGLILSQIKLNSQLSSCAFFKVNRHDARDYCSHTATTMEGRPSGWQSSPLQFCAQIQWVWGLPTHTCTLSHFSRVWLFATPRTVACQSPLSMGFSRHEYWSGLPCPLPGDLPDPEITSSSLTSPALVGRFFTTGTSWEAQWFQNFLVTDIVFHILVSLLF